MGDYRLSKERLKFVFVAAVLAAFFGFLTAQESSAEASASSESAQPSCPPNQIYRPCLVDCMDCDYRGYCALNCNRSGCDCIGNFYRLEPDGPCEPVTKCPQFECGENEIFRDCGPVCERCHILQCHIVTCERRCYCKEGYLRDYNWTCVPADQCPPKVQCTDTEDMAESGKIYEYCLYADTDTVRNETRDQKDCYCKEGYKRNGLGYCVEEKYCSYVHCVESEVYMACPRKCNTTCWNYGDPDCVEDNQCYPGCFCKEGMVMDDYRNCVPYDQCPPGSNPYAPTPSPISEEDATEADTESATAADAETTTEAEMEETTVTEAETTETEAAEEATTQTPQKAQKTKPTKGSVSSKLSQKAAAAFAAKAAAKAAKKADEDDGR